MVEPVSSLDGNIIVRGIGVALPDSLRLSAATKATKLLRHHQRIMRIRIDFEQRHANDSTKPAIASGRVEISGPDLVATVESAHLSKSLDLLVDKLDRMLRERTKDRVNRRNDRPEGTEFRDFLAPRA
jgi:putative sigma-54 modulation protein